MKRIILCALIPFTGCMKGLDKTTPLMNSMEYQSRPAAASSLFVTDEAVLSGASIEQILNSKVVLAKQARLAILQFGQQRPSWQWWSEDLSQLNQDLEKSALAKLRQCARLADVSLLPGLMVPEKNTIPYLREAAARFQADLLLVYRASGRAYDRPKFLAPDEVKAKRLVEAILLDVRTGIVPFSSASAKEYVAKKTKDDYGFSETIAKAEIKATALGLEEIAGDLVKFLESVP